MSDGITDSIPKCLVCGRKYCESTSHHLYNIYTWGDVDPDIMEGQAP